MLSNLRNLRNSIEYYKTYIERYTKFGKTHKVWKDTQNLANIPIHSKILVISISTYNCVHEYLHRVVLVLELVTLTLTSTYYKRVPILFLVFMVACNLL